jgi:hypothetical protein
VVVVDYHPGQDFRAEHQFGSTVASE